MREGSVMKLIFIVLLFLSGCTSLGVHIQKYVQNSPSANKVWLDADFACKGNQPAKADPDDCVAAWLFARRPWQIVGVSTTGGNDTGEVAFHAGLATVTAISQSISIYRGEDSCSSPMVIAFAKVVSASPKEVTYLALGPLTNLATVIRCRPEVALMIKEVVFVGGRRDGQRFKPNPNWVWHLEMRDLNFEVDPSAAREVFALKIPVVMIGFEAGLAVPIHASAFAETNIPEYLKERLREWSSLSWVLWGVEGVLPFDPVAVAYVLWPQEFTCEAVITNIKGGNLVVQNVNFSSKTFCTVKDPNQLRAEILTLLVRKD